MSDLLKDIISLDRSVQSIMGKIVDGGQLNMMCATKQAQGKLKVCLDALSGLNGILDEGTFDKTSHDDCCSLSDDVIRLREV